MKKAPHIVSLREDVTTGKGFTKRLEVVDYFQDPQMSSFIEFKTTEGKTILVNKNNVKSILKVEE